MSRVYSLTNQGEQGGHVFAGAGGSPAPRGSGTSSLSALTKTGMAWPVVRLNAGLGCLMTCKRGATTTPWVVKEMKGLASEEKTSSRSFRTRTSWAEGDSTTTPARQSPSSSANPCSKP